jgi:MFS family permease
LRGLGEGIAYAFGFMPIRTLLLMLSVVSLSTMPLMVLMPVLASEILHGGPGTFGLLMAASGFGALTGALFMASRKSILGLGRIIALMAILLGVATIGVAFSTALLLSLILLMLTGFAMMAQMASNNTILQTIVEEDKRGRVMSLYTMAFMGTAPLGSLLAGAVADALGVPWTLAISGCVCVVGGLIFAIRLPAFRKHIRPIYIQAGILPDVSSAIQSVVQLTVPPEDCV